MKERIVLDIVLWMAGRMLYRCCSCCVVYFVDIVGYLSPLTPRIVHRYSLSVTTRSSHHCRFVVSFFSSLSLVAFMYQDTIFTNIGNLYVRFEI